MVSQLHILVKSKRLVDSYRMIDHSQLWRQYRPLTGERLRCPVFIIRIARGLFRGRLPGFHIHVDHLHLKRSHGPQGGQAQVSSREEEIRTSWSIGFQRDHDSFFRPGKSS